jgi:hypothetical protein
MWVLAPQDTHLMSKGNELEFQEARLRTRNESMETRAERIVIMPQRYGGGAQISRLSQRFGVLSMDRRPRCAQS